MTIEDPVEFLHEHRGCLINQREVGQDTHGFRMALKHVLRQDPDVILVGELRDLDTISVALTAAETGHLVFATLHAVRPGHDHPHRRRLPRRPAARWSGPSWPPPSRGSSARRSSRRPTARAGRRRRDHGLQLWHRAMIRDDKLQLQIQSPMQAGAKDGMQTMNAHLASLVKTGGSRA